MKIEAKIRLQATESYLSTIFHSVNYGTKVGDKVVLSGGYAAGKSVKKANGVVVGFASNGNAKIGITDWGDLKGYRGEIIVDTVR